MLLRIMSKNKEWPITVRLEEEEYNYVNKLATTEDRSLSGVARYLLKWGIDQHKKAGKLVYPPDPPPTPPKGKPAVEAGDLGEGRRRRA